jgi:cobalt-zinc-cadmium efflux system membrane fusion protein
MDADREYEELMIARGEAGPSGGPAAATATAPKRMGFGQKAVVVILLTVVLLPPLAGFYSYFSGTPLHLLA